jgi:glycosyltransferase involved in cell wall biosynthesis
MYGAEHVVLTLAGGLARLGHECTVGVFENRHRPNLEIAERAKALRLPVEQVVCDGRVDTKVIGRIRKIIEERNINVVHAHGFKADVYCYAALRSTSTPLVSTCHNWLEDGLALSIYGMLDRFVLRYFDAVAAVSPAVSFVLHHSGVAHDKIQLIDNGIDLSRFEGAWPKLRGELGVGDAPVIGFVGRLSPEKGLRHLLQAASRIFPKWLDATLVLVGDGPERESLQKLAGELGISHRIHFTGQRFDTPEMYASFDVLVLPSLTEGLPLTLLEALASRRAVVASSVGAVPNIVAHETTGLLVTPGDVEGLASSIERLLRDSALRKLLGEQGYVLVSQRYSSPTMTREYAAMYQNAIRGRLGRLGV